MKKQLSTILVLLTFYLTNCNIDQNVKETIADANLQTAKMVADSLSYFKTIFQINTQKLLSNADSLTKQKVKILNASINSTARYIDSLDNEMSKYDNDLKNIQTVNDIFIQQQIGDTLFNRIDRSIRLAEDIALNSTIKSSTKKIGDNMLLERNVNEFKKQFFSFKAPDALTWLLKAFEIELYRAASTSIQTSK